MQQGSEALYVDWQDCHTGTFHYVWLRDNAPENRHESGQKILDTMTIPLDLKPKRVDISDPNQAIEIQWAQDDHITQFSPAWLRAHVYEPSEVAPRRKGKKLWSGADFGDIPDKFDLARVQSDDSVLKKMLAQVRDYGFALLKGIPVESKSLFKVIDLFGFVRDTNYGPLFDVKVVTNPSNLAFTSATLGGHTDNPYRHPVPTLQLLHVLNNNVDGGDSTLVDGFQVAETFKDQAPEHFAILACTLVTFRFRSEDTDLSHEATIIETNPRDEVVGIRFNNRSMQTFYLEPAQMTEFYAAYHAFARMLEDPQFKITFKLAAGEAMLFDNQRVLHGRIGYTSSGNRHLQGCYADIDSLLARLAVLERNQNVPE
jgi:gamma-butyrobetaine dioxygenase